MSKSFSTGNSAFLIRVATALAASGGQLDLGQTQQELGERLVGRGGVPRQLLELPAHRRQPELPQVGLEQLDRDIGHRQVPFHGAIEGNRPSPTVEPGPIHGTPPQAKNTLTGPSAAGPLRSWSNRLRSGRGTWT